MTHASRHDPTMCKEGAEVQQLERSSVDEYYGGLSGGTDLRESPPNDQPPLVINTAREEGHEPSLGGVGGLTVTGNKKYNRYHHGDDVDLQKKLDEKEEKIGQLVDTMAYLTDKLNKRDSKVSEVEQLLRKEVEELRKEVEELRNINVNLELYNGLLRSELEHFNYSETGPQSSLTSEQQMGGMRAVEGATRALESFIKVPLRSAQGSIVTAPEDDLCHSNDSFVFMPEPMNFEARGIEELPNQDERIPLRLQSQIKELEEAFRKERNNRTMLTQKYKTLKRDLTVVSKEREIAMHRAEVAEEDARKAREEECKLRERLERMARGPSSRSAPSSQRSSTVSSPQRDPYPTRDPLTCVWPVNNYRLIMPPGYNHSQGGQGEQSQNRNTSSGEFELVAQGADEENAEVIRPLEWDMAGPGTGKRERPVSITSSLEYDEIEDIKRRHQIKKLDDAERWSCQACKYRNRARRSECDYCGTVDAAQRRRHHDRIYDLR